MHWSQINNRAYIRAYTLTTNYMLTKAALTHRLTWADAPGPTTIRGPIMSCRIKTRRECGMDSPLPNTCTLIRQHGYDGYDG